MSTDDSKPIDWDKPIQTRDGREVRIYTTEGRHPTEPVVGEIGGSICPPILTRWRADGSDNPSSRTNENDIINVPQQHTLAINVYRLCNGEILGWVHESREEADKVAGGNRIACFEHPFKEGEGLE